MVLCSSHTPQGSLWVIWAIGCGGFMPLEPPSVLLQGLGLFCLGTLFARFGLWIATNMATAGPKHPQEFPWASGGAGWQWGAAKPMPGPSRAHETAISPSGLPDGSWALFFFSGFSVAIYGLSSIAGGIGIMSTFLGRPRFLFIGISGIRSGTFFWEKK